MEKHNLSDRVVRCNIECLMYGCESYTYPTDEKPRLIINHSDNGHGHDIMPHVSAVHHIHKYRAA